MTLTTAPSARSASMMKPTWGKPTTLFALVGALLVALALSACGNAAAVNAANQYISGLNMIGAQTTTLSNSGDVSSPAFKSALAAAVPQMQNGLAQMKSAQPSLTGEAATIAGQATPEVEKLVNAAVAMNTALESGDTQAVAAQLATYNAALPTIQGYIDQWNTKVAKQ